MKLTCHHVIEHCTCPRVIYFVLLYYFWVSIDSGVEGSLAYSDEQYYTPRQQGKR